MDTVAIDENIRVGVAFDKRRVRPMWFLWRSQYHKVRTVNFTWRGSKGAAGLYYYSVTDENSTYELSFNSLTLEWVLCKVCVE